MSPSKRKRAKSKPSKIRSLIAEANEDALLLEPAETYDKAITGLTCGAEPVVVYDYDLLVLALTDEGQTEEDAIEWIEYNILGSLGQAGSPVVTRQIDEQD